MGHDAERGNYYHLYINGQYWGLYNTDERPEASYGATYFGGNKEDYDVIKVEAGPYTINATDGNMTAWTKLYNLVQGRASPTMPPTSGSRETIPTARPIPLTTICSMSPISSITCWSFSMAATSTRRSRTFSAILVPTIGTESEIESVPDGFRFFAHDSEHTLLNVNEDRTGPYPAGNSSVSPEQSAVDLAKTSGQCGIPMLVADHIHRHFFNGGVLTPHRPHGAVSDPQERDRPRGGWRISPLGRREAGARHLPATWSG